MTTHASPDSPVTLSATAPLEHLAALDIQGDDAEGFLQGQTSAQVNLADGRFAALTCFCTPKGRMLANGQLARMAENHYRLIVHASLVEPLMAHLKKFAPFYKVSLDAADAVLLGASRSDAETLADTFDLTLPTSAWQQSQAANDAAIAVCYPEESDAGNDTWRWLFILPAAEAEKLSCQGDTARWPLADVRRGLVWLDAEQQDSYLPQMVNWEALGGISFKKGCYTGQEVVARAHFRGQVKKRLSLGYLDAATPPANGTGVTATNDGDEDGKNIGEVVASAAADNGQTAVLAVLNTRPLEKNPALDIEGTTLTLTDLPYAIERVDPEDLAKEQASAASA
ncbi:CAF17-like 4Fe-4S cluster assembly/insertion protein YgfZ [Halomonas garicola]|uniref:CAF17-like 4Fe-4S cluster assembly/insertion protein YgfZ n=1 Tax=Halomonas garicola TaxID=1690008 RepID=UPI0028A21CFD|nr:folate-binding protein [Halomonas garicola]